MTSSDLHHHRGPHFSLGNLLSGRGSDEGPAPHGLLPATPATGIGPLMLRGADCLQAALCAGTADAGLNEARYRVLSALCRVRGGACSQAELASCLLQSESNLSTLLERMSGDGLITRARSAADRRRSLIQMTQAGRDALARADATRAATISHLMREFTVEQAEQLAAGLQRLVGELERSLEAGVRRASGLDPAFTSPPRDPRPALT